jgi:hypothetical protein
MHPILNTALQAVAAGNLSSATVLSMIQANTPYTLGDHEARFSKVRPGEYKVLLDGKEQQAVSAVEAKLVVVEHLINTMKQPQAA